MRGAWTPEDEFILRKLYPETSNPELARLLDRNLSSIDNKATKLGLRKSARFMATGTCRFQKGQTPANKGVKRGKGWAPGRMAATQFQPGVRRGVAVELYQPIGSTRITKDGLLQRKVHDGMPLQSRWKAVHCLVWETANGPVPAGHIVVFKDRRRTNVEAEITLDRLELISRAENCRRNSVHRLPPELREVIQLTGALKRKINRRARNSTAETSGRSTRACAGSSPVASSTHRSKARA